VPLPADAHTAVKTFSNHTDSVENYIVTLLVESTSCRKLVRKSVVIYPHIDVTASVTDSDPNNCHPLTSQLTADKVGNSPNPTYSWQFGDGASSPLQNPSHTYYNYDLGPKTFTPQVTITDKWNICSATKPLSITVQPYIKASFTVDKISGCSPHTISVIEDSQGGVSAYAWDKDGDGLYNDGTSGGTWSRTYTNPTTTNTPLPITIRLRVSNTGGCTSIKENTITVNPPVTASFTTNDNGNSSGCSPLTMDFTSTTTNATIYNWVIDGTSVDNKTSTRYVFENFGGSNVTKSVAFIASNQYGCSSTVNSSVTVKPWVQANFAIDTAVGCSPMQVTFTNASSAGATTFEWDIENDGSINFNTKDIPTQNYGNPSPNTVRIIPVKLTARNTAGCLSTYLDTVYVNPGVSVNFSLDDNLNPDHCSPLEASFTANASASAETFLWQFGNQGSSTLQNPDFRLTNTSSSSITVPVTLTASNSFGCSATYTENIDVEAEVVAAFSLDNAKGCVPFNVSVGALTSPAIANYTWTFDGNTYTGPNQAFSIVSNKTGVTAVRPLVLSV
jgi:PKD repeat protein